MKSPKAPQPTQAEKQLQARQVEELTRLDEEENRRVKGLVRRRLGGKSLIGAGGGSSAGTSDARTSTSSYGVSASALAQVQAGMRPN